MKPYILILMFFFWIHDLSCVGMGFAVVCFLGLCIKDFIKEDYISINLGFFK